MNQEYAIEQYETLRQEALGINDWNTRGHGLSLILTRGMAAWFEALRSLGTSTDIMSKSKQLPYSGALSSGLRYGVTTVLADIILASCSNMKGSS